MYSTLYIRTLQGVLISSLCSLSGPSERVSYSYYDTGCKIRVLDPSRGMQFIYSVGPPRLLLKGYEYSSLGVK